MEVIATATPIGTIVNASVVRAIVDTTVVWAIVEVAVMATTTEVSTATGIAYSALSIVTSCDAGRAVMTWATEISTVPTVVHAEVLSVWGTVVVAMSMIVAMSAYMMPSMCATIGHIEVRTAEVEVVTMRITTIDAEVPVTSLPIEWTIEIGGCYKSIPLPFKQDITQIEVTTLPIGPEHIIASSYPHQVVEINLISCLVLLVSQIQLISHLISEEEGLVTSLLVAHCVY